MSSFPATDGNSHESIAVKDDKEDEINDKSRNSFRVDRYGFLESDYHHSSLTISEAMMKQRREKETERSKKWARMLKKEGSRKLKERARKGIPDAVRGESWRWILEHTCSEYNDVKHKHPDLKVVLGESSPAKGTSPILDARTIDEVT